MSGLKRPRLCIALASGLAAGLIGLSPAIADDWKRHKHQRHNDHYRHYDGRHDWRGGHHYRQHRHYNHYRPPQVIYAQPRYYYPPPRVVYLDPPPYYYAPVPGPAVNFEFRF